MSDEWQDIQAAAQSLTDVCHDHPNAGTEVKAAPAESPPAIAELVKCVECGKVVDAV